MKSIVVGVIALAILLPTHSAAQRGGFRGGGGGFRGGGGRFFVAGGPGTPGFSGSFGLPPIGPIPPLAGFNGFSRFGFNNGFGFNGFGFNRFGFSPFGFNRFGSDFFGFDPFGFNGFGRGFGRFGNGFDSGFGWGGFPLFGSDLGYYGDGYQGSIQNQPTIVPVPFFPPSPPPPPVVPETHDYHWTESGDTGAAYSIVSKDGSARVVVAAWVQGNSIRYITPDGTGGQVALDSVDRAATNRTNAQKHLRLPLPPN